MLEGQKSLCRFRFGRGARLGIKAALFWQVCDPSNDSTKGDALSLITPHVLASAYA